LVPTAQTIFSRFYLMRFGRILGRGLLVAMIRDHEVHVTRRARSLSILKDFFGHTVETHDAGQVFREGHSLMIF